MVPQRILKNVVEESGSEERSIPVGFEPKEPFVLESSGAEVDVVTDQGVVTRINIRCGCGRTISLVCDYGHKAS